MMSDYAQFAAVIEAILAAREDMAVRLGDGWPEFEAKLAMALRDLAQAPDDEFDFYVDELLFLGINSPAGAIFRQIMNDYEMGGGLVEASRSGGPFDLGVPKGDALPILTDDQFRAGVRQTIALWTQPQRESQSLGPRPRYLNAGFFQATNAQFVPVEKPLSLDGGPYRLVVNVSDTIWGPGSATSFPDELLGEPFRVEGRLSVDVVLRADQKIQVTPWQQKLVLPPTGDSRIVFFDLTFSEKGRYALNIDLLYQGHFLQSRRLEVEVVELAGVQVPQSAWPVQDGYITFSRTSALSAEALAPLAEKPRRLTIVAERDIDYNRIGLHFYDNTGQSLHMQESRLTENNLTPLIQGIRDRLRETMAAYTGGIGSDYTVLTKHLGLLADAGRTFYRQLLPGLADEERLSERGQQLKAALRAKMVIQVAPLSAQLSVPWELLYERKGFDYCERRTKLCTTFRSHGAEPSECPHYGDPLVVCPHGFWGYRYIIEQLPCRVNRQTALPNGSLPLLIQNDIPLHFPALVYPHFNSFNRHWHNLQALAPRNRLKLTQVKTFEEIGTLIKGDAPDLMYFYAHGGRNDLGAPYLMVGNNEKITVNNLDAWGLNWPQHHPLVVLNACDSADYTPDSFENLIHFFWQRGAAGVIGTQCEVKEMLADALIIPFFRDFLRQVPAGQALFAARRQLLYDKLDPRGLAYSLFAAADVKLAQPVIG